MKILLTTVAVMMLAACGSPESPSGLRSAQGENAAVSNFKVEPGTFKLFLSPGGPQNLSCAFFTELTFFNGFQSPVAQLENGVTGSCDVLVPPARRVLTLGVKVDACNTKHLTSYGIEILDHRERTCKDLQPAQIMLQETDAQGLVTTLYSDDRAAATILAP